MQNLKNVRALIVLLSWTATSLQAQSRLPAGSQAAVFKMTSQIADTDSSLPIKHYSLSQRIALLKQLYQSDQRYRDSLENGSRSTAKQQLFSHKMVANDQVNQVLLGKVVETFGWPTQHEYGEQGPQTAWLIVWHARPDYQKRYYPLIKRAYQQGFIKQSPTQLAKRLTHFSK